MITTIYQECQRLRCNHQHLPWLWIITIALWGLRVTGLMKVPWLIILFPLIIHLCFMFAIGYGLWWLVVVYQFPPG